MSISDIQLAQGIASSVDPVFYGALISICLFGICLSQSWTYIHTNDDRWTLQSMIALLFLLVFGCTVLDGLILHHYLVSNFGNYLALFYITPELSTFALLTLLVIVISNLVFASRVWRLQRVHWALIAVIFLTALGALVPCITLVKAIFTLPSVIALNSPIRKIEVGFINILSAVSLCVATAALWWSFKVHMEEVSMRQTILQRLCTLAINRGILLTFCQIMVPILFFWNPTRFYWALFQQSLAPLHYVTMLSTLNARSQIRDHTISTGQFKSHLNRGSGDFFRVNELEQAKNVPSVDIEAGIAHEDTELERTDSSPIADPPDAERPASLVAHRGFPLLRREQHVKLSEKGKSKQEVVDGSLAKIPRRLPPIPSQSCD